MTLRHALDGLERRGMLIRLPSRAGGAFVAEPKIDCDLTGLAGFTEQMQRAHLEARAKVLGAQTVDATPLVATALRVPAGALVHEIVRVRSANRVALALERSFFPAEHFPDLLGHRLPGSLYRLLEKHYVHQPHTAAEFLEPVTATLEDAAVLNIEPGTPLMRVERTAYSVAGLPVEFAHDLYRADRVRLNTLSPSVGADPGALRVEQRIGCDDPGHPAAKDLHGHLSAHCHIRHRQVGVGDRAAQRVPVAAGGDVADDRVAHPNRLVAQREPPRVVQ